MKPKTTTKAPKTRPGGDTAEGFLDAESRAMLGMPQHFNGDQLAPYSEGVRLLWLNVFGAFSGNLFGLALIWMMRRLQELVNESEALSKEDQWEEAVIAFMTESAEVMRTRAKVVRWAAELGQKKTTQAVLLANRLLDETEKSDIAQDPAESEGEGESGNGQRSREASPST